MRVVVIGGGLGGMASAARLAKLGHEVTLLERLPALGGAIGFVESDGFRWDAGPSATLLPAVLRDLFRKSGRQLEQELELEPQDVIREHRFEDDTSVQLRGGSRGVQYDAFESLKPGFGQIWCDYVASYADEWEALRRNYLERPWSAEVADKEATALIFGRETLAKRMKKALPDERLRLVAGETFVFE